jgi:hypothetical protein
MTGIQRLPTNNRRRTNRIDGPVDTPATHRP